MCLTCAGVQGVQYVSVSVFVCLTYAGGQGCVPGPPLPGHALEGGGAVQRVTRVTAVRDAAAGEVTLVADLEAKLRNTRVLTVGQLKTWRGGGAVGRGAFNLCETFKLDRKSTRLNSSH